MKHKFGIFIDYDGAFLTEGPDPGNARILARFDRLSFAQDFNKTTRCPVVDTRSDERRKPCW